MSTDHLSDNQIQQYALDGRRGDVNIANHLAACPACNAKLVNYQVLAQQISILPQPAFDFNLADLVLQQLPAPKAEFPWISVLAIVLTVLFLGTMSIAFGGIITQMLRDIPAMLATLLGITTLGIILGQVVTMYKEHQEQMKKLDFN